jgi:hypothetical protein
VITNERQYPPKLFNKATKPILINFLNQNIYKEIITLNSTNINYGSGDYEIYSSTIYDFQKEKYFFFNHDINDSRGHFGSSYHTATSNSGKYKSTNNYIVNNYFGDWIIIKLPVPIILTKIMFYSRLKLFHVHLHYGNVMGQMMVLILLKL